MQFLFPLGSPIVHDKMEILLGKHDLSVKWLENLVGR